MRPRLLKVSVLQRLRCPHHRELCRGVTCCCRDRHWRLTKSAHTPANWFNDAVDEPEDVAS